MNTAIFEMHDVSVQYSGVLAVSNVTLALYPGSVHCLLGENGAGKSSVINVLSGVESPTSGTLRLDGADIQFRSPRVARQHGIATVFQDVGTLPLMSVARNFVLGAEPVAGRIFRRLDLATASSVALSELKSLGIRRVTDATQLVGTMSGGERQALAIARATHFGARVLILDEPTAALGVRESATVLRLVEKVKERGVSIVFVTHNAFHAELTGDHFTVLRRGEAIAQFDRGQKSLSEITDLMAGGDEFKELLSAENDLRADGEHV